METIIIVVLAAASYGIYKIVTKPEEKKPIPWDLYKELDKLSHK